MDCSSKKSSGFTELGENRKREIDNFRYNLCPTLMLLVSYKFPHLHKEYEAAFVLLPFPFVKEFSPTKWLKQTGGQWWRGYAENLWCMWHSGNEPFSHNDNLCLRLKELVGNGDEDTQRICEICSIEEMSHLYIMTICAWDWKNSNSQNNTAHTIFHYLKNTSDICSIFPEKILNIFVPAWIDSFRTLKKILYKRNTFIYLSWEFLSLTGGQYPRRHFDA